MDSQKAPASSSYRKQHKPSPSLASLYDVLADLDETQLQYLIQEVNHTGHQNVPVSQAVSAFEAKDPSKSLSAVRASLQPAPAMQRKLSKSQRGQLRLQNAIQRAPSVRIRVTQGNQDVDEPLYNLSKPQEHKSGNDQGDTVHASNSFRGQDGKIDDGTHQAMIAPERQDTADDTSILQTHTRSQMKSPAYKRISRPEFSLPPGITVTDLLHLLELEFLSSNPQQSPSPNFTSSPSSALSADLSSAPLARRHPSIIQNLTQNNSSGSRPLRKHSSRLDIALEAERSASGVEGIALGMLEPRPLTPAPLGTSACSDINLLNSIDRRSRGATPPVVLEGIFDVLENQ